MDSERRFDVLRQQAESIGWRLDINGVAGTGADGTGIVRARIDDAGRLSHIEIDRNWWHDLGPDRLRAAILEATTQAANDRLATWSARVAERAEIRPSSERPLSDGRQAGVPPQPHETERRTEEGDRAGELIRMLELLRAAMSELDDHRQRVTEVARQSVTGHSENDRVTVRLTGGQLTDLEISRRWLHQQQPTGRTIAGEVEMACSEAYRQMDLQVESTFLASPAVAEVRKIAANPAVLLRRLGLGG
ncbi:hypothetical protein [Plantactinospora sp. KLBMP9567]|uniref:hypothetical protein n=1 Tax=Plantactinospora sp. KLBMP9567 TaxID=3085900 RepID=UPI002980D3AF|nr:hypothetical protein [Plantactinospora sp. KLBMP9567]MDW5324549.1 hypothetical protein [Plantactinospora sp. KLBMP9567]